MRRALITGAGGFVGAHLAARLVAEGWVVAGTARPGAARARLAALGLSGGDRPGTADGGPGRFELVEADLSDPVAVAAVAARAAPDVVFDLAAARAAGDVAARARTAAVNTMSGLWLVDALPPHCQAVVRLGSSTEYADVAGPTDESAPLRPRGFFGATKAAGSLLVTAAAARRDLRAVVLRAFQVYGAHDHPGRLVPTVLRAAREGTPVPLTGPGRRRDWVHVDDVVDACLLAAGAEHLTGGQVLNIGSGRQVANEELVAAAARVTGRPILVEPGAHPGRLWDAPSWVCEPSLAAELLGWRASIPLDEGLARCWAAS